MNYLRGAVSAISAPYQYYRDLPPINPSTLTGAIDVIVVERPTDAGDNELVCSPFHVRFGKLQVLRPGEKTVDVSVNGHPIPYKMKIGDAGEAFFVFEIEGDVPDELITSPILLPTRPGEPVQMPEGASHLGKDLDQHQLPLDVNDHQKPLAEEPEPLDLDAFSSLPLEDKRHVSKLTQKVHAPSSPRPQAKAGILVQSLPSPPSTPAPHIPPLPYYSDQDARVDDALGLHTQDLNVHIPGIEYHDGIALDAEGYHTHDRENSSQTVRPQATSSSSQHSPAAVSNGLSGEPSTQSFLLMRAASEHVEYPGHAVSQQNHQPTDLPPLTSLQEYSWEWGAFPQPSPVNSTFGKAGRESTFAARLRGKGREQEKSRRKLNALADDESELGPEVEVELEYLRTQSVPPELDGSPTQDRKGKVLPAEDDVSRENVERRIPADFGQREREELVALGAEGKLGPSKTDPTRFILQSEERRVGFELSIVEDAGTVTVDEVAKAFSRGKVDFERFLEEESIVTSPDLVIRWAGNRYMTRADGSPLIDALVSWREVTLRERAKRIPKRPTSPMSEDEDTIVQDVEDQSYHRAKLGLPEPPVTKPSSLSWVQWWGRRRISRSIQEVDIEKGTPENGAALKDTEPKEIHVAQPKPAYPPMQRPTFKSTRSASFGRRKYAKTLRLTSDQLRVLNLKHGANTITFSLSASGTIACTARIFLWASTDSVVISDIDGTITKSDGLGHVFAMIGRDWTHLGVAKLYTDITRNGYKIMYLTSRAIGQADATRGYLKGIKQSDYRLPEGPVIMSPDRLIASLHREVIMRKPEVFKMACLRDIQRLFGEAARNPFYAGFGNRITDALSYRSVNVPSARIFTIDSSGEVKMELLELAGYKSSYIHMTDLVDQMFPPIHRKWVSDYTDFNYWKQPLPQFELPELSPPSPTLSARSDVSQGTLARLRNFGLVSSRPGSMRASSPLIGERAEGERDGQLRQMSSFERLKDTLGFSRSASPVSYASYDSEDEDDGEDHKEDENGGRQRERRRSMTSMPGSLDERQFESDDEETQFREEDYEEEGEDRVIEGEDEAFDEDLLAAVEMNDVPFL